MSDVRWMAERWKSHLLLGVNTNVREKGFPDRRYNSAVLLDPEAKVGPRYDKIHRIPFGEFVPLEEWFPWMNYFAPYNYPYSILPGERQTRFPLGEFHFGVLICYEDTDPYLARQFVGNSDGETSADFLLNISNDGWFKGTSEHEEHLAICRFRAIESRRAVARAVNMGVSAMIDGNGRVLQPTVDRVEWHGGKCCIWRLGADQGAVHELPVSEWGQFKKVPAVLTALIPIDDRYSLYAHWGDWLPLACGCILVGGLFWSFTGTKSG
jgi:apolipoprotein N-acyltransferase